MRNQLPQATPPARADLTPAIFPIIFIFPIMLMMLAFCAGCGNDAIEANRRQAEANQALIEQTQRELAQLQANQNSAPPPSGTGASTSASAAASANGGCDKKVEATATKRAGEAYAASDTTRALGYYQDALTACPTSAKAALNLAHANETMSNRDAAIRYYRQAAASNDADAHTIKDAKSSLSRLGAN
jgi:tetratricopeptide (TPR) repeat protein